MSQETSGTKNTRLKENQSEYIETNRKILTSLTSTIAEEYKKFMKEKSRKRVSSKRKIHVTKSGLTGKQWYIIKKMRPDFLVWCEFQMRF